ncbi:MAG: DUF1599 domain-containing protein [Paludibacteraceae bacterium]|nr:DUF1599 domain-containing protein [Paludibacteraceae bacterium]
MAQHLNTNEEFDVVTAECRALFVDKLKDYGAAWRILRPQSLTDQIFIKANRIRTLETTDALVDEGIKSELIGIVNYAIIGMIQLELGFAEHEDMTAEQAAEAYDRKMEETKALMKAKNHDYGEAWRSMRPESYTDLILMKLHRTKQIEDNDGKTLVSEGIDANYKDMLNYAVFGLIRILETDNEK